MAEAKHTLRPMRAGGAPGYIRVGMLKEDRVMDRKVSVVELSSAKPVRKPRSLSPAQKAERALERQIRQIERNFGPDWKW
jgi:hypothetical protein